MIVYRADIEYITWNADENEYVIARLEEAGNTFKQLIERLNALEDLNVTRVVIKSHVTAN